jgi:hypothetical protein
VHRRGWWLVAGVLVALVAFGGTIQAGVLAPQLRIAGVESVGGSQFTTIQNVSWRAWNITDVHLDDGTSTAVVAGHVVQLTLHEGPAPTDGRVGPALTKLVVGPGGKFNLKFSGSSFACQMHVAPRDFFHYAETHPVTSVSVPAAVAISTPFGVRDTDFNQFGVSRC